MAVRTREITPGRLTSDVAAAVGLVVLLVVTISLSAHGGASGPLPYVFALLFGVLALLRRWLPLVALCASALVVFVYYTCQLPPIGVALPLVLALLGAAEAGRTWWAVVVAAVVPTVALGFRLRDDDLPLGILLGPDSISNFALAAAAIALGVAVRSRRTAEERGERLVQLTQEQAKRDAEVAVRNQRDSISRDLHDSVGHALSVIALHAGAGAEAVGRDDAAARDAFARIREQATSTLTDIRALVKGLRDTGHQDHHDVRSITDVADLVRRAETEKLRIDLDLDVAADHVSAPISTAIYRVVQEALTNVVRHFHAAHAAVSVRSTDGAVSVEVSDDGVGHRGPSPSQAEVPG